MVFMKVCLVSGIIGTEVQ